MRGYIGDLSETCMYWPEISIGAFYAQLGVRTEFSYPYVKSRHEIGGPGDDVLEF